MKEHLIVFRIELRLVARLPPTENRNYFSHLKIFQGLNLCVANFIFCNPILRCIGEIWCEYRHCTEHCILTMAPTHPKKDNPRNTVH